MKISKSLFISVISVLVGMVVLLSITSISLLHKSEDTSVAAYNSIGVDSGLITVESITSETTTSVTTVTSEKTTTTEETTSPVAETTGEVTHETVPYAFHDPSYYADESRLAEENKSQESESIFWAETREASMNNYKKIPTYNYEDIHIYNDLYFKTDSFGLGYTLKEKEIAIPAELSGSIPIGSTLYFLNYGYLKVVAYDNLNDFSVCLNEVVSSFNKQDWTNDSWYPLKNIGDAYLYTGTDPEGDDWVFAY